MRAVPLFLLALAGCNSLLGIDEVQPIGTDGRAVLDADTTPHGFGDVVTGQSSVAYTLSVANTGRDATGALEVGLDADAFVIASDDCDGAVLAPTDVCTIAVQFRPSAPGAASGALTVAAAPGGTLRVELSGRAYAPGDLKFDQTMFDFMTVDVGNASAGTNFTVTNTGGSPTGALETTIGGDTAAFDVLSDGCAGATLDPDGTCVIKVQFAPDTYGPFTLSVLVTADPGGAASVSLGGTGRESYALTVTAAGDGTGTIDAPGLTCTAGTCTGTYPRTGAATSVPVTATPDAGVTLTWGGECAGAANPCTLLMDRDRSAIATFTLLQNPLTVTRRFVGSASGKVTSNIGGIDCGSACSATFPATAMVTLTATPNGSNVFQGWTGACTGHSATCTITMSEARAVTATFKPPVNYIFATSAMYAVTSIGGLEGADDICAAHAAAAGMPGTFKAFLSTSSVNAKDRIAGARGWIRPDGKPVIDQLATTFATGQVFYSPELDELGGPVVYSVMTGTRNDGTADVGSTCSDYTSASGYLTIGAAAYGAINWTSLGVNDCSGGHPLYCMQTDFDTAVTVPPLASPIAFVTKGFFDTATGLAAADTLCKNEAQAAGLDSPTLYKALLGTSTMAPASRFSSQYNFMRPDNVPLNASGDSFFDKSNRWIAPVDVTADKTYIMGADIAIGSLDPTTIGTNTCQNWTVNSSAAKMDKIQTYSPEALQYAYAADCTRYAKLLCLYSNQ